MSDLVTLNAEEILGGLVAILNYNKELIEKWLQKNASIETLQILQEILDKAKQHYLKRNSITAGIVQQWLSSSPIKESSEVMEDSI